MHELEILIQERTAKLTETISSLHEAKQSLRSMAARLAVAELKERQRLAGVLHDDLQQLLVAALFQISEFNQSSEKGLQNTASSCTDLLRQAIQVTRSLAGELSPPVLHHTDFSATLTWLKNWMDKNYGLQVELAIADQIAFEKEEVRILLFESVRELLFNVIKHAKTKAAFLGVDRLRDQYRIEVRDKGCGFDMSAIGNKEECGLGLVSIQERLSLLGGSLNIESSPSKGSKFTVLVPAM